MLEKDGTFGNTEVLIYPRPSHGLWEGKPLIDLVASLRSIAEHARAGGEAHRQSRRGSPGSLPLSADIIASMERDGARASIAALLGVAWSSPSSSAGTLRRCSSSARWSRGSSSLRRTMLFGVRINFANFIAFPITFGIGVDYAVNIMSRYVQDGEEDPVAAVRSTGAAVALCSLTTIIGYSSLLSRRTARSTSSACSPSWAKSAASRPPSSRSPPCSSSFAGSARSPCGRDVSRRARPGSPRLAVTWWSRCPASSRPSSTSRREADSGTAGASCGSSRRSPMNVSVRAVEGAG